MAEKLTELSWVAFAKTELTKDQRKLVDDAALVKALAGLDKADERKPADRQKALQEVVEQIPKLVVASGRRKKELGKAFDAVKDKLYALLEVAEAQQKAVQKALDAEKDKGEDEEEDSPALLTTKMIPLLREVRKGELVLQALVALAGKETVVLLSRRAISPARGKLLKEQMSNPSGLKFIRGECQWENSALTFVVQAPAAALAKRIRAALLAQTELRLKVRVRGDDGEDTDGEDEAEEAAQAPGATAASGPGAAGAGSARAAAAATGAAGRPAPPGGPASAEQLAYVQRLRKVRDAYDAALKAQHPESTKLRALMGFASEKAAAEDYVGAGKALDTLYKLLAPVATGGDADALEAMLADWQAVRNDALVALKEIAGRIAAARHPSSAKAIVEIKAVIANLPAKPASLREVTELRRYLDDDRVVADVCDLAEDIRSPMLSVLDRLYSHLAG
jgi:hypothetical protein